MSKDSHLRLQLVVFALVAASFTNVYLTQPVLPVLQAEFAASTLQVSFTVAAVILGIALSNLPFGVLADRLPIQPIILTGGIAVAAGGLICAFTDNLWVLIGARFLQGLFIPALTTCIAAYLAKTLPIERLNVVMGAYVSATVVGGLGGRLLGGWIHPPLHWRYAFVSAAVLILVATFVALKQLPRQPKVDSVVTEQPRFLSLLRRWELVRIYLAAAGGFFIFSSVFNYLPFRLAAEPFSFSTELITLLYLVYVMGIFMGPLSGRISNRIGSGNTLIGGTLLLGASVALTLLPSISAIILGLLGLCAGFFAVHAAAVGSLNRRLTGGQGRANALYVLFYYVGGWIGITGSGFAYTRWGWQGVILICLLLLLLPFMAGIGERRDARR
ncbi:MFS transporter [Sedimenticola hydrogenitrophicus]|uniref:MFS transporter n=1 Tax=Sedimenticola hydrogenitrophicus TaxID=2967975 RepID=UPI0023B0CB8D|nr:MFS transporter [Sedimenticola hydrogenitrophicus]